MILEVSIVAVCLILGIQSYWDIKYREIPLWMTLGGAAVGITISVLQQREWIDLILAFSIGLLVLLLGKMTKQAIGYGDGALICMMGCYFSIEYLWMVIICAVVLAGVLACILFVFFKKKKDYSIPFVPFLLLGNVIVLACGKGIL